MWELVYICQVRVSPVEVRCPLPVSDPQAQIANRTAWTMELSRLLNFISWVQSLYVPTFRFIQGWFFRPRAEACNDLQPRRWNPIRYLATLLLLTVIEYTPAEWQMDLKSHRNNDFRRHCGICQMDSAELACLQAELCGLMSVSWNRRTTPSSISGVIV